MTSSLPKLSDQLKQIQTHSETIQKRVSDNWATTSENERAQTTTRLRTAVQILYAEGLEGEVRRIFVDRLVPRCFIEMNAIAARNFNGISISPTPYESEYATRVLKAIHTTAGALLIIQKMLEPKVPENRWGVKNETTTPEMVQILKQIVDTQFTNLPVGCFEEGVHRNPLQAVVSEVNKLIQTTQMKQSPFGYITNITRCIPLHGLGVLTGKPCLLPLWKGISIKVGGGEAEEILGPVDNLDTKVLRCIDSTVTITDKPKYTLEIRSNFDKQIVYDALEFVMPKEVTTLIVNYILDETRWEEKALVASPYHCHRLQPMKSSIIGDNHKAFTHQMKKFTEMGMKPTTSGKWLVSSSFGEVAHITLMHPIQQEMLLVMREDRPLMCYPATRINNPHIATDYTISSKGMEVIEFQVMGDRISINEVKAQIITVEDLAPVSPANLT